MSGISRLLVLATAFFALAASPLHAVPTSYLGGTSWVAGSWSGLGPGNFPDSPLLDVLVDGPLGADFTVAVDFTAPTAHEFQTNSLTLGVGDVLNFTNGRRISTFNSGGRSGCD